MRNWIDERIEEGTFAEQLTRIMSEHSGFVLDNLVYKIGYEVGAGSGKNVKVDEEITFYIARHYLMQHVLTNAYYALVDYNELTVLYGQIPVDLREALKETALDQHDRLDLAFWVAEQNVDRARHTYYTYMLEQCEILDSGAPILAPHKEPKRFALDLEVIDTNFEGEPILVYSNHFQSPITPFHLRVPALESITFNQPLYAPHIQSNWWHDSKIHVRGIMTETHVFLMLQADKTPAYQDNAVPLIPLFWGLFIPKFEKDDGNLAVFAGSATRTVEPKYDFDSTEPFLETTKLMPLLKNYITRPGNGIDDIIVYRSKNGAKYQLYQLIAEVTSEEMPPEREHGGKQYPQTWQSNPLSAAYQYQHNPNRYRQKRTVETSKPILFHAEDGVRGTLPDCLVSNPLSIRNNAIFKHRVQTCPDVHDLYHYFLIEGISPFTKSPATPFRPLGVAIRKTDEKGIEWNGNVDYWRENGIETNPSNPTPTELIPDPEPVSEWDLNGDGIIDAWDENGDGIADAWDRDGDGVADAWDTNYDGIADYFGESTEPGGDIGHTDPVEPLDAESYYLMVCNTAGIAGDVYTATINGFQFVNQFDAESDGSHHYHKIPDGALLKDGSQNIVSVQVIKATQERWEVVIVKGTNDAGGLTSEAIITTVGGSPFDIPYYTLKFVIQE